MPADLVGGGYHLYNPEFTELGRGTTNVTQGNIPGRSNLVWHGAGSITESTLTTEKTLLAAVPVEWGDVISKITIPFTVKVKAAAVIFVALYEGLEVGKAAKLIAQSTPTTAEVKLETNYTGELTKSVLITTSNAPNGYVYAGVCVEAASEPGSVAAWKPKAKGVFYGATSPVWALEVAQKETKVAAAEVTVAKTSVEIVPFVTLT